MRIILVGLAYVLSVVITTVVASLFNTNRILAGHKALGADISANDQMTTYLSDLTTFTPTYGAMIAIGLALGFAVAYFLKRVIKPLAFVAYPLAGAAAMGTLLFAINMAFPGVGAIGGARDVAGIAMQCLAGGFGGLVFAVARPQ